MSSAWGPSSGIWVAYTPSTVAVTLGNGTLTGLFCNEGSRVYFTIRLLFGSTTALTGQPTFTTPTDVHADFTRRIGQNTIFATFADATGGTNHGSCDRTGTNVLVPYVDNTAGTYIADANISSIIPFTWATSDDLTIAGWYRPA